MTASMKLLHIQNVHMSISYLDALPGVSRDLGEKIGARSLPDGITVISLDGESVNRASSVNAPPVI